MKRALIYFKGSSNKRYNPETAIEVSAKDILSGKKDLLEALEAFNKDDHETFVVVCSTLDEVVMMERVIAA